MCAERRRRQRGLSLVELMVGLVVALLVSMAATSSARMFMASQRQGAGLGGMTVNGATALAAIKSDAASAGLGFFGKSQFLCHSLYLSIGATVRYDGTPFSPVKITRSGSNDELELMYASEVDGGAWLFLEDDTAGASASVGSLMPVVAGQAVLLAPDPKARLGNPCLVRTVTANTAATPPTSKQQLTFDNTGEHNKVAFTVAPSMKAGDGIAMIGKLNWSRYKLDGTNLRVDRLTDGKGSVIVRNVMSFRAQYGITDEGGTTLTGWQDAAGSIFGTISGTAVDRVRALRIGMVTRSPQREKPNSSGTCEASTAKPRDPLDPTKEITPDVTDWQCYRYRTAVVVVPLRNLAW